MPNDAIRLLAEEGTVTHRYGRQIKRLRHHGREVVVDFASGDAETYDRSYIDALADELARARAGERPSASMYSTASAPLPEHEFVANPWGHTLECWEVVDFDRCRRPRADHEPAPSRMPHVVPRGYDNEPAAERCCQVCPHIPSEYPDATCDGCALCGGFPKPASAPNGIYE